MRLAWLPCLMLLPLFAACLDERSWPAAASPCDVQPPTSLDARDTLILQPDRTYIISVHEHGVVWGNLTLKPCRELAMDIQFDFPEAGGGVKQFALGYVFEEGETPQAAAPRLYRWGLPKENGGDCDPFPSSTVVAPRGGPRGVDGPEPRSSAQYVILGGNAPYGAIRVRTGPSDGNTTIPWRLEPHPALGVATPEPKPVSTMEGKLPPRTQRLAWGWESTGDSPTVVHAALWHLRQAGASAGLFWDRAWVRVGSGPEARSIPIHQSEGGFACAPNHYGGYVHVQALDNLDALPLAVSRVYEDSGATPPGSAEIGFAVLRFPFQ